MLTDEEIYDIVTGVVDAGLWADCEPLDMSDDTQTGGLERLEMDNAGRQVIDDIVCKFFAEDSARDVLFERYRDSVTTNSEQFGHDLYLTAARHGSGFWDGRVPSKDLADALTAAARAGATSALEGVRLVQTGETTATVERP